MDEARERAKTVSSEIHDMIGIRKGEVTKRGPGVSTCEDDPEHLYKTRHPWSLYGVPEEDLKQGFQRLRDALPKNGWKIVDYGPNSSKAKSLELTADSETEPYSVNAVLIVSTPTNPNEKQPLLAVTVVSGCFRAPEGTKLDQEF
ncbi:MULTISPECIES: hypothetical protein [unclassified Streptomyces]|uniref:hypothetical protein n=1 Tax=unclassified Streptomyces TaxID=2593676 RepID=UPI001487D978|nr:MULTISPECIES: hypothetical protein [unclassified Streptomyces]